ncbi:hypothetical protein [Streptosporangium canum]|uniref:hypothetical protein n=1 Tax=Streptosporangium canum TaxID=324952 RepID=UPI0033A122C3
MTPAEIAAHIRAALAALATTRDQALVPAPDYLGGVEPAWVGAEAERMLAEINIVRAVQGHRPIGMYAVRTAEHRTASHHMGAAYLERYAARCAALAGGADYA